MGTNRLNGVWCGLLGFVVFLATAGCATAQTLPGFYVAPDGTPAGDGSKAKPWDLETALNSKTVKPGDTIWLTGGTHKGGIPCTLAGTAEKPILVRALKGQRATVDGRRYTNPKSNAAIMLMSGGHVWFWDLEIIDSNPDRVTEQRGSFPTDVQPRGGVFIHPSVPTDGFKFINCIFHEGCGPWGPLASKNEETYGCLLYNYGWLANDRGHGHGVYMQNKDGVKVLSDNILFNQYGFGVHIFGSDSAYLNNIHIQGNIIFNNGSLAGSYGCNLLLSGGRPSENCVVTDNYCYYPPEAGKGTGIDLGFGGSSTQKNATLKDNYTVTGGLPLRFLPEPGSPGVATGNVMFGTVRGDFKKDFDAFMKDYPDNTFLGMERPKEARIFVRPNKYEKGRANICVFNWPKTDMVMADISASGLEKGDKYVVLDAQNYYGKPVSSGQYDGKRIHLPMNLTEVAQPLGKAPIKAVHTSTEFGAFVIMKAESLPKTFSVSAPMPVRTAESKPAQSKPAK